MLECQLKNPGGISKNICNTELLVFITIINPVLPLAGCFAVVLCDLIVGVMQSVLYESDLALLLLHFKNFY